MAGTSMAAPHVAGLTGLILSRFPSYSSAEVRHLIEQSAEDVNSTHQGFLEGPDKYIGHGRINAHNAVAPPTVPSGFTVSGEAGDQPYLSWNANTEPDLAGYHLYKNEDNSGWFLFASVGKNTTSYTDQSVIIGEDGKFVPQVCYKITAYDISDLEAPQNPPENKTARCKPLGGVGKRGSPSESTQEIPAVYALQPSYPNPFNPITQIAYQLPEKSTVQIAIYNFLGKKVQTLVHAYQTAGYYEVQWDGTDAVGNSVAAGPYWYRLVAQSRQSGQSFRATQKMVYLK